MQQQEQSAGSPRVKILHPQHTVQRTTPSPAAGSRARGLHIPWYASKGALRSALLIGVALRSPAHRLIVMARTDPKGRAARRCEPCGQAMRAVRPGERKIPGTGQSRDPNGVVSSSGAPPASAAKELVVSVGWSSQA
jgi:hypothetical protein